MVCLFMFCELSLVIDGYLFPQAQLATPKILPTATLLALVS